MAANGESEAWTEEEAGSPMAWTIPYEATDGRYCCRVEVARPDQIKYRFFHVVHMSRLKKARDQGERPKKRLVNGIAEVDRFDI